MLTFLEARSLISARNKWKKRLSIEAWSILVSIHKELYGIASDV